MRHGGTHGTVARTSLLTLALLSPRAGDGASAGDWPLIDRCLPEHAAELDERTPAKRATRSRDASVPAVWSQLAGSGLAGSNLSGQSVDIDGDVAVVGAIEPEVGPASPLRTGVAHVFERVGNTWTQTAVLRGDDSVLDGWFGIGVAVDGDRIVVGESGAVRFTEPGSFAGAAYVFERSGAAWVQTAKLVAPDAVAGSFFGYGVTADGGRVGVGAFADDDDGPWSGSVYLFEQQQGAWSVVAKLTASNGAPYTHFGETLDLDGDVLAVGAHIATGAALYSGSAYVFERAAGIWSETAWLTQSDGDVEDRFGQWVAASGERVLIGARLDDDLGENAGAAYVFEKQPGGGWAETAKLHATGGRPWDVFGLRVDLEGDTAVVGGPAASIEGSTGIGTVQVFEKRPAGWEQTRAYGEPHGVGWTAFGFSVALAGGTVLVGAPGDDGAASDAGAAFVFGSPDTDGDGYPDDHDDCPAVADPEQLDADGDGIGDACDSCRDVDHDGYGSPASPSCGHPELDCDDGRASVSPGAVEIPGNGLDDDCNVVTPGGCGQP